MYSMAMAIRGMPVVVMVLMLLLMLAYCTMKRKRWEIERR